MIPLVGAGNRAGSSAAVLRSCFDRDQALLRPKISLLRPDPFCPPPVPPPSRVPFGLLQRSLKRSAGVNLSFVLKRICNCLPILNVSDRDHITFSENTQRRLKREAVIVQVSIRAIILRKMTDHDNLIRSPREPRTNLPRPRPGGGSRAHERGRWKTCALPARLSLPCERDRGR
jgi:hypothetical protein